LPVARKLVLAGSVATLVILLSAAPAAACVYGPASFESVAAEARVIVVGRVVEASEPVTWTIRVDRVLRGTSPDRLHLSGSMSPTPSSCDPSLKLGARYVVGMESIDAPLALREVWFKVEGKQLSAEFFEPPVDTVNQLIQFLASTPDTALPPPIPPAARLPALSVAALALLIVAASMGALRAASRFGSAQTRS
jgi:hypothetical protein